MRPSTDSRSPSASGACQAFMFVMGNTSGAERLRALEPGEVCGTSSAERLRPLAPGEVGGTSSAERLRSLDPGEIGGTSGAGLRPLGPGEIGRIVTGISVLLNIKIFATRDDSAPFAPPRASGQKADRWKPIADRLRRSRAVLLNIKISAAPDDSAPSAPPRAIEPRIIRLQAGGAEVPRRLKPAPPGLSPKSARLNSGQKADSRKPIADRLRRSRAVARAIARGFQAWRTPRGHKGLRHVVRMRNPVNHVI
jgi:hypothetical protein